MQTNRSVMVVMFSKELKEGTKKSHNAAENTKFVSQFLKGVLNPDEYVKLLTDFWYVYSTMEECVSSSTDPKVKNLQRWSAILNRTSFIERDLRYFKGPMWRNDLHPSEACNTYCYRIREVAEQDPYLLIAHHYTRYIGDLSGGKILKGITERVLKPPVGKGLKFYEFPDIPNAKDFKNNYREILNNLGMNESETNALITEANYAFRLNMYMFEEIQGNAAKSFWQLLNSFAIDYVQEMIVSKRFRK